jgi:hypothetical protein
MLPKVTTVPPQQQFNSPPGSPVIFTTRQQLPPTTQLEHSLRSHGSVFASLMNKFQVDLNHAKTNSNLAQDHREDGATWIEQQQEVTSCRAGQKLTVFAELHHQQTRQRSKCRRRSSGFGMSMSFGDGTNFLMTGTGPIGYIEGG